MAVRRRVTLSLAVSVLAAGSLVAGIARPAAARAPLGDGESAIAEAKRTGHRVEVTARTTESERVFANPDGTFTLEASAVPLRVRRNGGWVSVDTTLRTRADGMVAPKAVPVEVAFSGGGRDAPLARIGEGGRFVELGWPRALPEPVLDRDTATYRDVLPGVDLVMRATRAGFSEVLVVKTAEAAANPALRRITFGVRGKGVKLREGAGGGLTAVDEHGLPVFTVPPASMWDSGADAGPTGSAGAARSGPDRDPVRGPREGDRVTPIEQELADGALSVIPDASVLAGSDTRFPVFIDPSVSPDKNRWAMVNQRYPNTTYLGWKGDEGVGYITDSYDGWHRKRLAFRFPTRSLNGKHILSATFKAYETHAYSCKTSNIVLWLLGGLPSDTRWYDQPSWIKTLDSRRVAYGRSGCDENGAWVAFSATAGVRWATSRSKNNTHLGLRAGDESWANYSWKRFRNDARLNITYNTVPAKPTSPRTISPETACATGDNPPAIPDDPPMLVARLNDGDRSKGQKVKGRFYLYQKGGALISKHDTAYKLPGVDYTVQLPDLADGSYSWRVRAYDGEDWGPYSDWCEFRVDSSKPATPTISAPDGQTYTHYGYASFTFGPGGSTDVAKYRWSLQSDAPTSGDVPADSPTITERMRFFGPTTLRAWSYDAAGNVSNPPASLEFTVAGGSPRAQWRMDEGSGDSTADAVFGTSDPITGNCDWTTGYWYDFDQTDHALSFDGATCDVSTSSGIVFTDQNFSVTAWVRVGDVSTERVAVSQDRDDTSGFTLGVRPATADRPARFAFTVTNPDSSSATSEAVAEVPARLGEWVHLTGVYLASTQELNLYVDGEYAAGVNAPFSNAYWAQQMRMGRGKAGGAAAKYWSGDLDEVRVFLGALSAEQVYQVAWEPRPAP